MPLYFYFSNRNNKWLLEKRKIRRRWRTDKTKQNKHISEEIHEQQIEVVGWDYRRNQEVAGAVKRTGL
jgi:hypothetical protein